MTLRIVIGMILGAITGVIFGAKTAFLGEMGKLLIQLIKMIATPLIFVAIVDGIITSELKWKNAMKLFFVIAINTTLAATIGLGISNLLQPGRHLDLSTLLNTSKDQLKSLPLLGQGIDPIKVIQGFVPANVVQPFIDNNMIGIVILALFFGFGLKTVRTRMITEGHSGFQSLEGVFILLFQIFDQVLSWVIQLVPLAVFGVLAKTVGEYGFAPFRGLAYYVAAGLLGLSIQIFVVYQLWIVILAPGQLRKFWRAVKDPVFYSIGSNSSLATLPLTLKALDELKVSKASARLGACIGTNLNNDGILLYEAMAVLFVAQAHGLHLSLAQQIVAALFCVITTWGIAGIPEAGIISLSLVLTSVGLPLESLPLLLTVDWVLARARSVTNVLSDIAVPMILDGLDRRPV